MRNAFIHVLAALADVIPAKHVGRSLVSGYFGGIKNRNVGEIGLFRLLHKLIEVLLCVLVSP